ncbi:MAG: transposase family protein [Ferruginibacter sp.]
MDNQINNQNHYESLDANLTHIQWQVDEFSLPFWEDKFHRSVLVFVIDNCSKKIIGYAIGDTENSEVIKNAIRQAIFSTSILPFEIVMDNHSFTQTQSALNFENLLRKIGSRLTKTSNPWQKVLTEQCIKNLDILFKEHPGYLDISTRIKSVEDISIDELKVQYVQKIKTKKEVIVITSSVIECYNDKPQKGKIPNQVYLENQHPNPLLLSQSYEKKLFPNQGLNNI